MAKRTQSSVRQIVNGDGNLQVVGDGNTIEKKIEVHISEEVENKDMFQERGVDDQLTNSNIPKFVQTIAGSFSIQILGNFNIVNYVLKIVRRFVDPQLLLRRKDLLEKVEKDWIDEQLKTSLYNGMFIDLGMEENPKSVINPQRNSTNRTLPVDTSILQVFDNMEHAMLILGDPGSGKTTMLLELGRACIGRAKDNEKQPIPIYLNLSWRADRSKLAFAEWIVDILVSKYKRSRNEAKSLVANDGLLLLLDGLDEVDADQRDVFIYLINQYRREHGSAYLVICSRLADYETLKAKLDLQNAVVLSPLTLNQISEYFERLGPRFKAIYQMVKNHEQMQELASVPLMLNIMTLAFQDAEITDIFLMKNINAQRAKLFEVYVDQMFKHPKSEDAPLFSRADVENWLIWLARKMKDNKLIPFVLGRMKPRWLEGGIYLDVYRFLVGLSVGSVVGLCLGLLGGPMIGSCLGIIGGIFTGVYFGLETSIIPIDRFILNLNRWEKSFYLTIAAALIVGLLFGLKRGLIFGSLIGLSYLLYDVYTFYFNKSNHIAYPGEGLYVARISFFVVSCICGVIVALTSRLIFESNNWLVDGVSSGILVGLPIGGITLIQYYSLRVILGVSNMLPWRLLSFLEYATRLRFLRRVGDGYDFFHRLLMEHFATLYPSNEWF